MDQNSTSESRNEAIDHIKFQMDLLKITGIPVALTGPSVMEEQQKQQEAVRLIENLTKSQS